MIIEQVLYEYLNAALPDPTFMEEPEERREHFYLLEKVGSYREDYICNSTFILQSYAPSLFEAANMNRAGIDAMFDAVALDLVTAVELNTDYNNTDTAEKRYRYQAVIHVTHYIEE